MKNFVRLPHTSDLSLKAWSAADEHILQYLDGEDLELESIIIYHDRFGYLTCHLSKHQPKTIIYLQSQKESITLNATANGIPIDNLDIISVLDKFSTTGKICIMKIPKSLDLFRLYLNRITDDMPSDGKVIAGFMTRHFSKSMLDIANEYFEGVEQSRAWKKSRLLVLSKPKKAPFDPMKIINTIEHNDFVYRQYLGVFSANHIDYATQFLLDHIEIKETENSFLDIGCGNGVIGNHLLDQRTWNEAVMIDDSHLATASTLLNIKTKQSVNILSEYDLKLFSDDQFDLIITNPPFHFEYEVDPSIAIQLMKNTTRILSPNGRLVIVANRHLNYKSQLLKWYCVVDIIAQNDKFIIYQAEQPKA